MKILKTFDEINESKKSKIKKKVQSQEDIAKKKLSEDNKLRNNTKNLEKLKSYDLNSYNKILNKIKDGGPIVSFTAKTNVDNEYIKYKKGDIIEISNHMSNKYEDEIKNIGNFQLNDSNDWISLSDLYLYFI